MRGTWWALGCLLALAVITTATLASSEAFVNAGNADAQGEIRVNRARVQPSRLPRSGGDLLVRANIVPRGGAIVQSVEARVETPTGVILTPMQAVDDRLYTANVPVPRNGTTEAQRLQVHVVARSLDGGVFSAPAGRVQQQGLRIRVRSSRIRPGNVPGEGGEVNVTVRVNSPDETLTTVTARAEIPGAPAEVGPRQVLNPTGPNQWQGPLAIGFNRSDRRENLPIFLDIETAAGDFVSQRIGRVQQQGFQRPPNFPPPPPF